jgi:putative membrane protein
MDGAKQIENAIAESESRTSGEIVPILVRRSSTVGHVPLLTFCLLLLGVVLFELPLHLEAFGGAHWAWLLASWSLTCVLAIALSRLDVTQRVLTPKIDQVQQVEMRAEVEFFEHGIGKTDGNTGILLYVSLMEHRAVVLADHAIADKIDADSWQELVDLMIQGIKRGDLASGMTQAIKRCGEILALHFPIAEDDVNELRDHLIVKN